MGKNKIQAVAVHMIPHPYRDALRDEIDRVYARHIRGWLEESSMGAEERKQTLNELIARLRDNCSLQKNPAESS